MRVVGFTVMVAALLACSGGGDKKPGDGTTPPKPFSPVDFCNARRDAQCAILASCYPGEPTLKGAGTTSCYRDKDLHDDYVACMAIALPSLRGISHKTMSWDEAGAKACIDNLHKVCPGEREVSLQGACSIKPFLTGKSQVGKPCYVGQGLPTIFSDCDASQGWCQMQVGVCVSSCQSWALEDEPCGSSDCNSALCRLPDLACDGGQGTSCGSCKPVKGTTCSTAADCRAGLACHGGACEMPVAGEPCTITDTGPFCAAPSVCIPDPVDHTKGTCGARVAAGSPCLATWQCKQNLVCAFDDKAMGTCQAPLAANAACNPPVNAALNTSDPCVASARCQAGTDSKYTCVAMQPLNGECHLPGDPMGELDCGEGFCRTAPANFEGLCSPLLTKDNGCDAAADDCDPALGLRCAAGQCEPAGTAKEGDNCKDDSDCESGRCTKGTSLNTCLAACPG